MKNELRLKPHSVMENVMVVELWHDGKLIGTVAGADGPGVRVISKHHMSAIPYEAAEPRVYEVTIKA